MAVAGLLVECALHFCGHGVRVLHDGVGEENGIHCGWQLAFGRLRMVRRHVQISCGWGGVRILWHPRGGLLRCHNQPERKAEKRTGTQEFSDSIFTHNSPPALHSLALTSPPLYSKMLRPEFTLRGLPGIR